MNKAKKSSSRVVAQASAKQVRISPRKARLVMDLIKGRHVETAMQTLEFTPKKGAKVIQRLLKSALSNAREHGDADLDNLWVVGGFVNMGMTMKRYLPRAQGRATPLRKRYSQITLYVGEKEAV